MMESRWAGETMVGWRDHGGMERPWWNGETMVGWRSLDRAAFKRGVGAFTHSRLAFVPLDFRKYTV